MKLTIGSILLSIALSATQVALVSPMKITGHRKGKTAQLGSSSGSPSGSVYFMTNQDMENYVVSADIGSDGRLTLREAFATGGQGAHGIAAATGLNTGPDGLYSQGAVAVSQESSMLAAVNAGSGTVSLFKIDANDTSTLTLLGDPVGSGGQFPMSVAFNAKGDTVCALNGGEINGVSCFKVNQTSGLMTIPGATRRLYINQTTPANGPPNTASQILFSPDDTQVVAAIKGTAAGALGYFAIWDISSNGSLSVNYTSISPDNGGQNPFGMVTVPIKGKNALLAADTNNGFDILDLDEKKASGVTIPNNGATCWSSYSPQTGDYYIIAAGGTIFEYSVDNNLNSKFVQQYNQSTQTFDAAVATVGNKDFMYILASVNTSLSVLSLNGPGQASNLQFLDVGTPAAEAGLVLTQSMQGIATFMKQ